ncbi:hypothetical protein [Pseudonocardia sp.]|jgi:hypothetical protein|uniref:hypothetical protein n=1 Tax=Pseudonocardia sp. TaxID=60912 RepID=UPI00261B6034|nr:hypothetical protein [Pseudonocardia sp.]MCW2722754.1 hypothetical protein [Pseudonocardia sp.]
MAPEIREWSVPAPVRTLLWWPAISFVLVIVFPDAATGAMAAAGAALALIGALVAAGARRLRKRAAVAATARAEETTVVMSKIIDTEQPTTEIPQVSRPAREQAA